MTIEQHINQANKCLSNAWPLQAFIAGNPFWQMTDHTFADITKQHPSLQMTMTEAYYRHAYQTGKISHEQLSYHRNELSDDTSPLKTWITDSLTAIDKQTTQQSILYCKQLGEFHFQLAIDRIQRHLWVMLKQFFSQSKTLSLLKFLQQHNKLPNSIQANNISAEIERLAGLLHIPDNQRITYFKQIYFETYGWASFVWWLTQHPHNPWFNHEASADLILLVWLHNEVELQTESQRLYQPVAQHNRPDSLLTNRLIWQQALEGTYQAQLLKQITSAHHVHRDAQTQWIFCIDTRSEGLRRHLETIGQHETFGFAGFFGVPFCLSHDGQPTIQAPALLNPDIYLTANATHRHYLHTIFNQAIGFCKNQLTSPFVLFEMVGIWYAFVMLYRSSRRGHKAVCQSQAQTYLDPTHIKQTIGVETAVDAAAGLLTGIGLTKQFSDTIILCGHRSRSVNNPFAASLDCGACGGNGGQTNAIVMATLLNDNQVRAGLKTKHIHIPYSTRFVAACHETTADRIIFYDQVSQQLLNEATAACQRLSAEKSKQLPGDHSLARREVDWSELIPEQGLLNNAAFIIAPRKLTAGIDLERRTFLHSYEPSIDTDGAVLASILNAPALVAHWINAQYYFSTVCPKTFGAGNKAIHNVIPHVGVMAGNLSDLKIGLPEQSVLFKSKPMHTPLRLTYIIQADKAVLETALREAPVFKQLIDGGWATLHHLDTNTNR